MAANTRPPRTGEVPTNITTQEVPTIGVLSSLGGLNTITDLQVPTVTTIVAVENIGVEEEEVEEVEELLTSAGDRNRGGDMIMIGLRLMIAPPIMTVVGPHLIIEAVSTTEGEAVSTTEATTEATTEGEAVLTTVDVSMTVPVTVSAGSDRLDSQDRPEEDTIIIRMGVWTASVLVLAAAAVVARAT